MDLVNLIIFLYSIIFVQKVLIKNQNIKHKGKIAFLIVAVTFVVKISIFVKDRPANLYEELGICRNTALEDIKDMYKSEVRRAHPDKNPSVTAHEDFIEIQKKYQSLKTYESRARYELYKLDPDKEPTALVVNCAQFYIVNLMLSLAVSVSKKSGNAGKIAVILLCTLGIYEFKLRVTQDFILFFDFLPYTISEQLDLIREIFPCILMSLILFFGLK